MCLTGKINPFDLILLCLIEMPCGIRLSSYLVYIFVCNYIYMCMHVYYSFSLPQDSVMVRSHVFMHHLRNIWLCNLQVKCMYVCWQSTVVINLMKQISTLAGNQTPSYFVWEVLFTMAIIGLGLLLFALLIGNMQNFLQALGKRYLHNFLINCFSKQVMNSFGDIILPHLMNSFIRNRVLANPLYT